MTLINGLATAIPGGGTGAALDAATQIPQARIPAADADVEKFNAAMTPAVENMAEQPAVIDAAIVQPTPLGEAATGKVSSIGDNILGGLEKMRADFSGQENNILNTLHGSSASGAMQVEDMVALQMQVAGWAIQQELVSKVVSKSTQTVDQLMKAQ
ncbi:EscI/YscI/HrpB family type III secretion system inner rod protein [Thalassospira sp. MA62]|nr:EscI/YscI/HrpB family type III secretion system inner rod protein [Thalassospira sp. MA62]